MISHDFNRLRYLDNISKGSAFLEPGISPRAGRHGRAKDIFSGSLGCLLAVGASEVLCMTMIWSFFALFFNLIPINILS